jgi:hypothetical protein
VAQVLKQTSALQILLAALGSQPDNAGKRLIRYKRLGSQQTVCFSGGLICISNLELPQSALAQALKSRVPYLWYDPSEEELAGFMRHIATSGWSQGRSVLSPNECWEVAEYVITESRRLGCRLDLRNLVDKAFPDFLQHRDGHTETNWRDLVTSTLEEAIRDLRHTPNVTHSREERLEAERQIVRAILAHRSRPKEQLAEWHGETDGNKSDRAFYRRRKEVAAERKK